MAKSSISDEELQLKKRARRRLVGAVALVTLVVVFLPMVLDDQPKPLDEDIAIKIPSPEADDFAPKTLPRDTATPAPVASAPEPVVAATPSEPTAPSVPPTSVERPEVKTDSTTAGEVVAHPKKAEQPEHGKEAYVVQVGTFASANNAKQAHKKIVDAGIKSYTETLKMPQGDKVRVRAGPFATREAAQKAQTKLKAIGLDGPIAPKQIK